MAEIVSVSQYIMLQAQEGSEPRRYCPNGHVVEWWCGWPIYPMKVGKRIACFVCGWIEEKKWMDEWNCDDCGWGEHEIFPCNDCPKFVCESCSVKHVCEEEE